MKSTVYDHDAAILGGGPAGCATALSCLDRGLSVVVVTEKPSGGPRIGEALAPPVQHLLRHLRLWPAFLQRGYLPACGTRAMWGAADPFDHEFLFHTEGDGWHVDRRDFDSFLLEETARRGVRIQRNSRVAAAQRSADGWRLSVEDDDDTPTELRVRFIADATGSRACFAQSQGAGSVSYDRLTAVYGFFHVAPQDAPADARTWVEASETGWWYSARIPHNQMVVAYLSDADLLQGAHTIDAWKRLLDRAPGTRERLRAAPWPAMLHAHGARTRRLKHAVGANWLAVGDAASTFDPLSSQGIFKALRSGIFAGYAIGDHLGGRPAALARYASFTAREFDAYLEARSTYYSQEHRWPQAPFWRRRHVAAPRMLAQS